MYMTAILRLNWVLFIKVLMCFNINRINRAYLIFALMLKSWKQIQLVNLVPCTLSTNKFKGPTRLF